MVDGQGAGAGQETVGAAGQAAGGAALGQEFGGPAPAPALGEARLQALGRQLQDWARALGFSQIGVAGVDLSTAEPGLQAWLDAGWHGGMGYMAAHGMKRARPAELVPGTLRVVTARMDYLPRRPDDVPPAAADGRDAALRAEADDAARWTVGARARLADPRQAVVSVYAQGRDYHKVLRQRLQQLADRLQAAVAAEAPGHRVATRPFTDSAPVLEVELASRSGLGWRGKHTLLLSRDGGSMAFLGELYTDLPLPLTPPASGHCGVCRACLDACPTAAIVAPYRVDARRCISYLTIEHDGAIPLEFRAALGNRIYGCDDCQLVCPWNKFARRSPLPDFDPRQGLDRATLLDLWAWDEAGFLRRTEGSAIRRIGYTRWRRNLAVALGNAWRASGDAALRQTLAAALPAANALVAEHIVWALAQRPGLGQV